VSTRARTRHRAAGVALAILAVGVAAGSLGQSAPAAVDGQDAGVAREIERRLEELRTAGSIRVAEETLQRTDVLLGLYQRRSFRPVWSDPARIDGLLEIIRETYLHGLVPTDYHLVELAGRDAPLTAAGAAELDLLRSDAFVRVAHDLRFGKLEPAGPGTAPDLSRPLTGSDAVADLQALLAAPRLAEALRALSSSHFVYVGLVRALAGLRRIQEAGGWTPIPSGPRLVLDSVDARVPALRDRLASEADLPADQAGGSHLFDAALERAVRAFQHRHGLNEDGVVGNATLGELNVPVGQRIDQVRANLERARWVTSGLPATFVVVNIAGAKVYLVREGTVAFETRAVVGASYTRTPVFRAEMRQIELNPTWTVPPSIVGEVLAGVRRDPDYFASQGFRLLDRAGNAVDAAGVDLAGASASSFPWTLRQEPGPLNPLGRIKFVFPNPHNVYLHDTPQRDLFARERRLFSHGCIRVENPIELAALILNEPGRWSVAALESALAADGETRVIPLRDPLPVLILYWTAAADADGELHFYRDVYQRDAALLAALDGR
jgi:murein L,D-transpeptidase YcbB/YkuD